MRVQQVMRRQAMLVWACVVVLAGVCVPGCKTVAYPKPNIAAAETQTLMGLAEPYATARGAELAKHGDNDFEVRLPRFDGVKTTQRRGDWCWAACSQMLLAYDGIDADQQKIVAKFGDPTAQEQSEPETIIMLALNPDVSERFQKTLGSTVAPVLGLTAVNADDVARELSSGRPLIIGLADPKAPDYGHAVVLVGVRYAKVSRSMFEKALMDRDSPTFEARMRSEDDPNNAKSMMLSNHAIREATIWDPLANRYETLTGSAFSERIVFAFSREMARETLEAAMRRIEKGQQSPRPAGQSKDLLDVLGVRKQ